LAIAGRGGSQAAGWVGAFDMMTQVIRKLIEDDLALNRLVLAPSGFAMEHRFAIRD
jgi:hypothetical protein